jgi:uncharacterized membrane-anchored protein
VTKIKIFATLIWLIGILLSFYAIFKIVNNIKLTVGFIAISFGILALIWISIARKSLSPGSSLRKYVTLFFWCLTLILVFSIWTTFGEIITFKGIMNYIGYIFLTVAYILFVITAYQIYTIGKEFGFQNEAVRIKKVMKEKRRK